MGKIRKPVTLRIAVRQQTSEEERMFLARIDDLIRALVRNELERRSGHVGNQSQRQKICRRSPVQ
jgi:hypothetical protein